MVTMVAQINACCGTDLILGLGNLHMPRGAEKKCYRKTERNERKKMFKSDIQSESSNVYKGVLQLNNKKINIQFKNGQTTSGDVAPKRIHKWLISI